MRQRSYQEKNKLLSRIKGDVRSNLLYSPDLTPCNYHLFGPLKGDLGGDISLMMMNKWKQFLSGKKLNEIFMRMELENFSDGMKRGFKKLNAEQ